MIAPADFLADVSDDMKASPRWLLWKFVPNKDPAKKPRKVPYYASHTARHGTMDTPQDIAAMATFEAAVQAFHERPDQYAGLGFALGPDGNGGHWQGIDLDGVSNRPWLADLAQDLPGYTEKSPSGNGWHAIGYGAHFDSITNDQHSGIEVYAAGRFFTVTGENAGIGEPCDLAEFVKARVIPLHEKHGKPKESTESGSSSGTQFVAPDTIRDLRSALNQLRADDRGEWVAIGHALKTIEKDQGRGLWLDWSRLSELYEPLDAARTWDSFKPTTTDYKSVFTKAQAAGWLNPNSNDSRRHERTEAANDENILVDFLDGMDVEPPPPDMKLDMLIPSGVVTLLAGHGGTGKSTLSLLMAVHQAMGTAFAGHAARAGKVMFYSCEDDAGILRWRLFKICQLMGVNPGDLRDKLRILDMTDTDPVLYAEERGGRGVTTWRYDWLREQVGEFMPDVLIVDNASDTFDANEISRARTREFIRKLAQLVKPHGGAVLLLAHVNKNTAAKITDDNETYSGNTAWHNSVRSRLFLGDTKEGLVLKHEKSNYGPKAEPMRLAFVNNVPTPANGCGIDLIVNQAAELARLQRQRQILSLIAEFYARGEFVSDSVNSPSNNAFKMLHAEAGYPKGLPKQGLFTLLREAERDGQVEREEFQNNDRKTRTRWRVTDAGKASILESELAA